MNFTINKINSNGSVDVTFSDGKKQNISGLPIGDETSLTLALISYGQAYEAGLAKQAEAPAIEKEVKALEGKKIDVEKFLADQEAERIANLPVEVAEVPVEIVPEVVETPVEEVKVETPIEETPAPVVEETTEVVEK